MRVINHGITNEQITRGFITTKTGHEKTKRQTQTKITENFGQG